MLYTHIVLHPVRLLRRLGIRKNLFGKKIAPFSTPETAFEAVGGCGLGMDLERLRKFMTKMRIDPDNVNRPLLISVVLHCLEGVLVFSERIDGDAKIESGSLRADRWGRKSGGGAILRRDREFPDSQPRVQGRPTALKAL
jgi:hypothetical protein